MEKTPLIGFVGQGFIGKNYADDFESRGYEVVRYALEEPYVQNKEKIKDCNIVFIAVPTPTTPSGFDDSIVCSAVDLTSPGVTVVIKSTILPGRTAEIQRTYSDRTVLYSPEFLSEKTASLDAAHPFSNIVGISENTEQQREAAEQILAVLPKAPFSHVCTTTEAELIKYAHNASGYVQIILFNIMYDLAQKLGADWDNIEPAIKADPMISNRYASPIHTSGHPGAKPGRGAGGHCFIKDFAALRTLYEMHAENDEHGISLLKHLENKNNHLLSESGKDLDLLESVYGQELFHTYGEKEE